MHQRVRMSQIVKKLISQSFPFVRPRYKSSYVEKLDRYRPPTLDARAIVGLTAIGNVMSSTCALDLKVPNSPLRIDCSKAGLGKWMVLYLCIVSYGKFPEVGSQPLFLVNAKLDLPTLELASVKLGWRSEEAM